MHLTVCLILFIYTPTMTEGELPRNYPERLRRATELQPLPLTGRPEDYRGMDKVVRKMDDGERVIAAKLYRDRQWIRTDSQGRNTYGILIDKPTESAREFVAYTQLRRTPLGIYIPEPYYLLTDDRSETVGLGVEWIEGKTLNRWAQEDSTQLLIQDELDDLNRRISLVNQQRIYLDPDMFNGSNIIIKPDAPQRIFFAECATGELPPLVKRQHNITQELEFFYLRS